MSTLESGTPFLRTLKRLQGAFWQRRVVYWWIRALWLALLVPVVVMAGYLWWGWQISWGVWLSIMLLIGVLAFVWSMRPINLKKLAHRLDNLLGMRAQLVTAYEVSQNSSTALADNMVAEQLVQSSVNTTVDLRKQVNILGRAFWLEMQALIAVVAILAALLIFDALRPNIPEAPQIDLPVAGQEPTADQVIPPDPSLQDQQEAEQQPLDDSQVRNVLEILADALRDQAVTHAVSEAIDRDDLSGAAEELRRLADRLDDLSSETHQELGDSLQEAADNIGEDAPTITDPLQRGKQALDINNLSGASQALEDLAEAIENLNEDTPQDNQNQGGGSDEQQEQQPQEVQEGQQEQGGAGAGEGNAGSSNSQLDEEEDRLPIDGQPLELENKDEATEDRVLQSSELNAQAGEESSASNPFTRQPLNADGDELGPDPLTYPWEKRDVVRQYFTP